MDVISLDGGLHADVPYLGEVARVATSELAPFVFLASTLVRANQSASCAQSIFVPRALGHG